MSHTTHVHDASSLKTYRTELPNLIDDMNLSVYAYRLYGHLKRAAGDGGECTEGLRYMAKKCGMAVGTTQKARKELLDKGLITAREVITKEGNRDFITIVDLWPQNFEHFSAMKRKKAETLSDAGVSPRSTPGVSSDNTPPVSPHEHAVSPDDTPGVSPHELKKELRKERTNQENTNRAREDDAVEIYEGVYGEQVHIPGRTKIEAEGIEDLALWREVVGDCFASRNPVFNVGKALHFYRQRKAQKADRDAPRSRAGPRQSNVERSMDAVRSFIEKERTGNVR